MSAVASLTPVDWRTANQACLQAEFDVLGARLAAMTGEDRSVVEQAEHELREVRSQLPFPAAIEELAHDFALTRFERDLLLLAAGVAAHGALAAACAAATGRVHDPAATFELAAAVLPDARWEAVAPTATLRRLCLLRLDPDEQPATGALRIEERVLFHLLGIEVGEPRLERLVRAHPPPVLVAGPHQALAAEIGASWEAGARGWPVVELVGDDPEGQEDVAALVAAAMGWRLGVLDGEHVPAHPADRQLLAALWTRESLLADVALLIVPAGRDREAAAFAEALNAPTFVAAPAPLPLRRHWTSCPVDRPSEPERRRLWRLAVDVPDGDDALDAVAGRFPVAARAIESAAPVVLAALDQGADPLVPLRSRLRPAGHALTALARRVEPRAGWDDLVLPEPLLATLAQIAAQVRHRSTVHDAWGFGAREARGLGITALFAGQSGTGKTLAAEVLARELGLDLHVIDLSAVVSKYIGETEKNLRLVFDSAEDGAILLFDEADALFGKRSEVKDSHDRYANLEVSYLLQRMEAYRGLAVLTTNARAALDDAFRRRLRFVVTFPFPDAELRERIWRGIFPADTPLGRLDWGRLASLDLSGGSIRSIAVNAAFLAAENGGRVRMAHIRAATRQEFEKLGRPDTGRRGAW